MKNITVAVCTDERGGMMFNRRRQSRDRVLIAELVSGVDGKIYISEYSRTVFAPHAERVTVCADPIAECPEGGVCFVENTPIIPHLADIGRIIIYNWNKRYPFDTELGFIPSEVGFKKVGESEFVGSSHERITKEVYER